jgi:hypothetical protein
VLAEGLEDALDCGTQSPGAFERRFATVILAEVSPGSTRLTWVNGGVHLGISSSKAAWKNSRP